jgi:hypothetical protein
MSWCEENGFTPGIVSVTHTFGATLNFHPHIHILLTEGGLGENSNFDFLVWRECNFFPEKALKGRFKYYLIKYLREWAFENKDNLSIPEELKLIWKNKLSCDNLYNATQKLYKIIWYVHIGERLENAEFTTRYIGRYAKRPCVSEANIIDYDKKNKTVSFKYKDKYTNTEKTETIGVMEFIGRLVRHIPEKNFRMIRYYGIYANCVKNTVWDLLAYQISKLFTLAKLIFGPKPILDSWRKRIIDAAGNDPLICEKCNKQMELTEIGHRARDGTFKIFPVFKNQ